MSAELLKFIQAEHSEKRKSLPTFKAGDTVNVNVKIVEGNKERIQQYQGIVIQIRNSNSLGETFTVRKISGGVAVERIFPVLSPSIENIEVIRKGAVRRARLFYLRSKKGKGARIKEDKKSFGK